MNFTDEMIFLRVLLKRNSNPAFVRKSVHSSLISQLGLLVAISTLPSFHQKRNLKDKPLKISHVTFTYSERRIHGYEKVSIIGERTMM